MKNKYFIVVLLIVILSLGFARAGDATAVNRPTKALQRTTIPQTHYEVSMGIGEMAPNSIKSLRMQSGSEMVYVLEGELIYMPQGKPVRIIKAGESFQVPPEVIHETKAGPKGAKFLATWVVEQGKGKQFVIPIKQISK